MKKILFFLLVIIGLLGYSQDEYYRIVDWKFYPENVVQLTDSTYLTDAYPFDYNDVGAIQRVVGNYVVDFVGHRYEVIDSTATTITVLDIYHIGQAPQTGQIARCYRSVGDGEAEYIGSIDYSPLDESSRWKLNGSDNELLWRQTIGKAENGLHKDFRTVKLGGDLIEPTTINQDNNSLKILNNGHGSVFSETGIAYTKIDTALFGDSTLITKMYANSRISDATYSSLWNSIATVAPSKNAVYDKIETLTPVSYCPLSMTVNTGTLVQGSVSDLCEVGGTDVIISESTGADPLRVTFAFNLVQRLTSFSFYGRYNGGATHVVYLEAYNYIAAEWQLIGELGNTPIKQWQSYNIFLPTKFISSGTVQVRFNHQGNGINTHQLILDYVDVNYGGAGGSSFETASEIAFVPTGNISGTNVQAAIQELDIEKEPLLTKGNLTSGSSKITIGGTATNALIGTGASIDVNEANIVHQNLSGHGTNTHAQIDTHITNDGDLSSTNEIQDLSLSGNTLSLSGDASTVDLSAYAPSSGSANYIWNGTTQQVGNYNITGDGEVGGNYKTEGTLLGNITTITPIISGQNCRISYLSKIEKTKNITLAIYFHGAGETENSAFTQIDEKRITDFLISKGIIVATSYANGVAWGNQTSQDDYYDLYDYINSNFDIGKVVFIAQSMGGLASLNLLASGRIDVDCWYGIFPVTNLYNVYQGVFASEIETAYGFSGSENYSAATSGFDPNTKTNSDFPKVRIRMTASYADNLVLRSQNSDLFFTKMNGYSPKCELVSHTGDHGDPTAFIKYDIFNHIVSNNLFDGELKKENDLNTNIFNNGTRTGFNTNEFKALFQIGNSAFSGINGLNDDTRTSLLIGNSGNLFGLSTLQLASTFNNATYPNYGVVLNNGSADGLNVDTWAMRNDGYANSSGGLSFAFTTGSDVLTSPHTLLLRKDGNSFFMKDIFLNQGYGLKANGISNAIVTADDGEVGAKIYAGSTGSVRIGEGTNEIARFSTGVIKLIPLSGTGTRLATTSADGTLSNITNASGYLYNDGTGNMIWIKTVPQSLSGTTPTLNASNGVNANLSISGATTLTLSNLISGTSGNIYLTNNASVYRIKIAGYTIAPASNITYDSTGILLPASSVYTHTSIGWYYNGTTVQIHKADYNTTTY